MIPEESNIAESYRTSMRIETINPSQLDTLSWALNPSSRIHREHNDSHFEILREIEDV